MNFLVFFFAEMLGKYLPADMCGEFYRSEHAFLPGTVLLNTWG